MDRRRFLLNGATIATAAFLPACARAADGVLRVEDFRSTGGSDRDALARAVEALNRRGSGILEFAAGRTYGLGPVAAGDSLFILRDLREAELRGNGAKLICETRTGQTRMFVVQRCNGLRITGLSGFDRGADLRVDWKGMHFIYLDAAAGGSGRVSIEDVTVSQAVSLLTCAGSPASPRVSGIRLRGLVARNCYYGLSFQENGDDVSGDLTSVNCRRTYFPYGVRRHDLALDITHDARSLGADSCILIKRYARDTGDLNLRALFHGTLEWSNLINLSQEPPDGETGVIENITAQVSIDSGAADPYSAAPLALSAYRDGRPQARSNDIWRNVRLSGCFGQRKGPAVVYRAAVPRASGISVNERAGASCA